MNQADVDQRDLHDQQLFDRVSGFEGGRERRDEHLPDVAGGVAKREGRQFLAGLPAISCKYMMKCGHTFLPALGGVMAAEKVVAAIERNDGAFVLLWNRQEGIRGERIAVMCGPR